MNQLRRPAAGGNLLLIHLLAGLIICTSFTITAHAYIDAALTQITPFYNDGDNTILFVQSDTPDGVVNSIIKFEPG